MSGERQRARKFLSSRGEIGWSEDKVVAFAESESSLARKQEREANCKVMCDCCGKYAEYWEPVALVNERWRHTSKKIPDEGKPSTHLCDAAAIWERGRKVEG